MIDYYQILGLSSSASGQQIKRAFKKLAVRFHPDKNPDDPTAEDSFKRINAAYQILSNPITKAQYDRLVDNQGLSTPRNRNTYYYQGKKTSPNSRRNVSPERQAQREAARQRNAQAKAKRAIYEKEYNKKATVVVTTFFAYLFIVLSSFYVFFTKYHYYLALEAYDTQQYGEAINELEQVLEYDEKHSEAYFLLGQIFSDHNRDNESLNFYTKAIENSDNLELKYFLARGIAHARMKFNALAIRDFEQVLKLTQDEQTVYRIAEAYQGVKNYQKVVEIYTLAIAKGYQADNYFKRGMAYALGKNDELAQQDFDIVAQNNQNSIQILQKLATISQYQLKSYPMSEYFYAKLVDKDRSSQNYYRQAVVQDKQKKHVEALAQLNLAIELDNTFDSLFYLRAVSHVRLSKIEEACQDWTKAKNLGYQGRNSELDFYCK